jgi:hypothetical protein
MQEVHKIDLSDATAEHRMPLNATQDPTLNLSINVPQKWDVVSQIDLVKLDSEIHTDILTCTYIQNEFEMRKFKVCFHANRRWQPNSHG